MTDQNKPLENPECFHRRHLFLYNLMHYLHIIVHTITRQPVPKQRGTVPHSVFFVFSFVLTGSMFSLSRFVYAETPLAIWAYLYLGVLLFLNLWGSETIIRKIFQTVLSLDDPAWRSYQFWAGISKDVKYQPMAGIFWAVLTTFIYFNVFTELYEPDLTWPIYVLTSLLGFILGLGSDIMPRTSKRFVNQIKKQTITLYLFDPRQSPIINKVADIYETVLTVSSTSVVVSLFPLLFIGSPAKFPTTVLAGLIISVISLALLFMVFIAYQSWTASLIRQSKLENLHQIHAKIERIYAGIDTLNNEKYEELENWLKLYERIKGVNEWDLSRSNLGRTIRYLFLPIFVAISGNWDVIQRIFGMLVPT